MIVMFVGITENGLLKGSEICTTCIGIISSVELTIYWYP